MDEQNPKQSGLNVEVPETDLQLSSGSITSDVKLNSGTDNNVDVEQEAFDMDKLSVSNPVKYLVTYNSPREWILDQREAEVAQMIRDTAMPEQASKVGSIAYAAGELKRKTGNMARDFSEYAAGVDAYLLPNANKDIAERAYKNMKKLSVQTENNRADYISEHGVDPDIYGPATNIMEVARDMVLTAGVAGAARRSATKAAFGYASSRLAPSAVDVAERFAVQQGKKVASGVAKTAIAGETFMRETGDRATQQAAQYMEATGDYDLKYYDPTVDLALNTGVSAINSAIEMSLGIERIVPDMIFGKRGFGRAAEEFIKGYISERSEEFLQNFFDQGGDVLSGYRDNISLAQAWSDSASAGWIGGIFGSGTAAGMYYLNRRRMIRQLQENGIEKDVAAKFVDKVLQDGINKTLSNMSSTVELRTREGPAYEKMKAGIKNALLMQGWNEKMVDPQTGEVRNIDSYVETFINKDVINKSISEALSSGLSIDDWLDVAQFTAIDNVLYIRPLGTVEDIQKRIDEQDAIIKRQTELKKTGADKPSVLQEARTAKAILQKLKANKLLDGEIERVSIEEAKTPEIAKEIDTATTDAAELGKANTAAEFVGNIEGTDEQKTKRLGNAVMKRIFKDDKRGFDAVMTKPEYANVRAAINSSAAKIFDYVKAHRAYGVAKDLYDALKLLPTVKSGNFISTVNTPDLTGQDPVARNAFLYNFVFNDAHATSAFIDAYLIRAEESINGQTKVRLGKKDLVGQAFKAMDALMQTQADVAGLQYTSIYNEDGSVADPNVAAVVASWQNLFVEVPEQRRLPQRLLEQFDLANENARLDEIYPEYTGDTIEVDGRVRTVYNSEGERINESAEALRNFWRWFGDSKVVDEQGRPLVVYHITPSTFDTFNLPKLTLGYNTYGSGIYTTTNPKYTSYGDKPDWNLMLLYMKAEHPADADHILTLQEVQSHKDKIIEYGGQELYDRLESVASRYEKRNDKTSFFSLDDELKLKLSYVLNSIEREYRSGNDNKNTSPFLDIFPEYDSIVANLTSDSGDFEYYVAFEPTQIKSVDNLGYYSPTDSRMLYQIGYASMRGEMVGDFIDANLFAHTGEGPNIKGWGNYFLADKDIDKRRYYEKFDREGPELKYDGKKIDEKWFEQMGITYPETRNIIKYRLQNLSITRKWVLDTLERELRSNEERFNASIDNAIARVKDSVGEEKARKIIADIEKMLQLKGGSFISLVVPLNPVAYPEVHKIQKKYFKGGKSLIKDGKLTEFTDDFVEVYGALYDAFGQEARETSFASAFARDFSELQSQKKSLEAVKKLDFDKFTGRTGFLYKGEDFAEWLEGKIRKSETKHGAWVNDLHRHGMRAMVLKAVRDAFVHNTTIDEQLNKIEDKYITPWIKIKPELKAFIEKKIDEEKSRFPNADVKAVKKFFIGFLESPDLDKWPSDGIVYQDWYKDEASQADKDLIDTITGIEDHGIESPKGEKDIIIGLVNGVRDATAQKRVFDGAKNALKNVKKEDFVFKPNASMYKTDKIPENRKLLDFGKRFNKQPKKVQEALINLYKDTGLGHSLVASWNIHLENKLREDDIVKRINTEGTTYSDWEINDMYRRFATFFVQWWLDHDLKVATQWMQEMSDNIKKDKDKYTNLAENADNESDKKAFESRAARYRVDLDVAKALLEKVHKIPKNAKVEDGYAFYSPTPSEELGKSIFESIEEDLRLNSKEELRKKLRKDPTIKATPNAGAAELTSKLLLKYGIRGIRYKGGTDKRGFVTFEPTPVTERLYSLDFQSPEPLVATHAISKEGMERALEVGGFAMPSLAITKDIDENSYGDIVFVAPASMAQPSRNTRVYDRDAWTPMIDFIEYTAKEGFADRVKDILPPGADWSMFVSNIEDKANSWPEDNIMAKQLFAIYKGFPEEEVPFIQRKFDENNDLRKEYLQWYQDFVMSNMQGRIFRGFTPTGTRRYAPVTLDNIVRELKTQPEHKDFSYYDFYGFHDVVRELVTRFKTPQDIKKEQDRIQDAVAVQNQESELQGEFYGLASELNTEKDVTSRANSHFALANALLDTEGTLAERLERYGFKNDQQSVKAVEGVIKKIKKMPVRYFEVKPQRAVRFNEFSAVFVPKKDSYNEIAERLEEQGANVLRYGSKEERAAMFDELVNGDDTILFQGHRAKINGVYDPELGTILIGKNFNGTTLPHEMAHYWLDTIFKVFKQAQAGKLNVRPEWMAQKREMFAMLGINENQTSLTRGQQEKFATMLEAYISGVGVTNEITRTFTDYLKWVPEKYRNLQQLSYVDEKGVTHNVFLDAKAVEFFNRWYENPSLPSLSTSPERQRFMNVTGDDGSVIRVSIKEVNDREKEFAQDAEEQLHTDQRLYNTLDENMPADIKPVADAQKVVISERGNFLKATEEEQKKIITPDDDRKRRWFERKSRETESQLAQEYIEKNPEHAHEVIFGDPELIPNDTGIDRATLINTYMATNGITEDKPEWAQLHTNIAINQSMAGTQLALSNDKSYRTYLDALREIEEALELKAATNYAGASVGARERFNSDIQQFLSKELPAVFATEAGSKEREIALKQMFEKARTTFSGNTTGRFLTQMDMEYAKAQKRNTDAFVKWAEKVIKTEAGAKLNTEQQAHLLKISAKAQQALTDIDSKDAGVAVAGALELRKWQLEKQKLMGVAPKKFSLFGDYAPRAMLASPNTLLFANIPSTAINTLITNLAKRGDLFGENKVSEKLIKNEIKRIKAIYGSTAMNLAQMEKPTSPTLLHGEKYSASGQKWYDPYTILGREDNLFRVPTFVNTLARIASKDAKATGRSADEVFLEYIKLNDQSDSAKLARKQALAVANMAVFTQNGALARCLNHIRSELNYLSRAPLGLDPHGFGLGSLIAPFLSTGANIAEMGIRGTIAPIVTLTTYAQALRTGKAIDPLKKLALRMDWTYFVFSAVSMALLAALTSDDDEFYIDPYKAGMGYDPDRPYDSINIGGVWVDLDFFGPFAIPMRTAAKVIQAWKKDNGVGTSLGMGYAESAKSVLGDIPLAESIINNQFEWAMKKPGAFASSYAYNQGNKLVPAGIKPISRALSRGQGWMLRPFEGTTVGRKFNRNYGFDGQELTSQDLLEMFTIKFQLGPDAQQYLDNILGLQ